MDINNVLYTTFLNYSLKLLSEVRKSKKATPSTSLSPVGGEIDVTVITDLALPVL